MITVTVTDRALEALNEQITKLNRKADRYGFNQATINIVESKMIEDDTGDYIQHSVQVYGNWAVKIDGWQLAGIVDTYSLEQTVINVIPGFDKLIPDGYRNTNARLGSFLLSLKMAPRRLFYNGIYVLKVPL